MVGIGVDVLVGIGAKVLVGRAGSAGTAAIAVDVGVLTVICDGVKVAVTTAVRTWSVVAASRGCTTNT